MVRMWPPANVLNYSFKDIRNNVWQILIYEMLQFNTNVVMWGSLTLALITNPLGTVPDKEVCQPL